MTRSDERTLTHADRWTAAAAQSQSPPLSGRARAGAWARPRTPESRLWCGQDDASSGPLSDVNATETIGCNRDATSNYRRKLSERHQNLKVIQQRVQETPSFWKGSRLIRKDTGFIARGACRPRADPSHAQATAHCRTLTLDRDTPADSALTDCLCLRNCVTIRIRAAPVSRAHLNI